jgi:hypothetical protein
MPRLLKPVVGNILIDNRFDVSYMVAEDEH